MRRVGGMLGDDGAVGLLRHDETKKIFAGLVVGVWFELDACVFGCGRGHVIGIYGLGLGALNRHARE